MRKKQKKVLPANIFNKLGVLFEEKGWEINTENNEASLFERFCYLLSLLNKEQQNFIIELTYNYQKISFNEYSELIRVILDQMAVEIKHYEELKILYVMPLIPEEDKHKIKSSSLVAYLFQSTQISYNKNTARIDFKIRHELTAKEINRINESPLVELLLVDDFIGTGETAIAAYEYYVGLGIRTEKIIIVSLVALIGGYESIKRKGIKIFSGIQIKKGISDYYKQSEIQSKINIMNSIEEIVNPNENYRFGYKSSEALITLVRTPNNTFPIYWLEKNKHNAPFPRR